MAGPPENVVVNFSGGASSAYMVWLFEQRRQAGGPAPEYIFCDTGAEHPATYQFINEIVERWQINLTCLRTVVHPERGVGCTYRVVPLDEIGPDLAPFRACINKYGSPTARTPICTRDMKNRPDNKYCKDKYGRGKYVKWLGIRADEPSRIRIVERQLDMFVGVRGIDPDRLPLRYLGEIDKSDKQDIKDFWQRQPFRLELTEERGNCVFCVKKNTAKVALAARREPELAAEFQSLLSAPETRHHPGAIRAGLRKDQVYRGGLSLPEVIAAYADISTEDLAARVTNSKQFDAGACSEACEAISIDADLQADLF